MSEPTKGPLRIVVATDAHGIYIENETTGKTVCDLYYMREPADITGPRTPQSFDNAEANARLIAASPEMLEALKAVVAYDGGGVHSADDVQQMLQYGEALKLVRAAIAKAEGTND